jgi:transcriptional antiterminator RfaH
VLRSTRGVRQLVRFGTHVPRLPDAVVAHLRSVDGLELGARRDTLKAGERVRVLDGPFAGLEGVLQQSDGERRACVLLECMHRLVRVTVGAEVLARAS